MAVGFQVSPVQLGPVRIAFPVALAAMSGYSDWPTRVLARRLGAGYAVAEAMLAQFVVHVSRGRKARRYLRVSDEDHPAGAQLMGSASEEFAPAALKLVEAGFDVIDVNFGCPVRKVLARCRGGHLLSDPERALEIVARLRDALPPQVPLTLKMRRGTDDTAESRDRFFRIFDGAWALGVAAITVHGRTVAEKYEGRSSWEFLQEVKRRAGRHLVFGSGDLLCARDCLDMMARTGVDGVSVARGAIGNPWIFREIRALAAGSPPPPPPSLDEQRRLIEEHYRLAEQVYGPKRAWQVIGKFAIKYSRLHPQAEQVRDALAAARRPEQWWEVINRWYGGSCGTP